MRTFLFEKAADQVRRRSPLLLRASLAVVFVWFGGLKVAGLSPVERLVVDTVPLVEGWWFLPLLGVFEVVLGLALLGRARPSVVTAMSLHLVGTFLVMITQPELAFQGGNPLLLTTEGEFVVKNLVLVAAALAVYGTGDRGAIPRPA